MIWVVGYFGSGLVALLMFDLFTKRLRSGWKNAVADAQMKLTESGSFVGAITLVVVTLIATWLFWPFVFIGAVTPKKEGRK